MVIANVIKCSLPKTHQKCFLILIKNRNKPEKECLNSDRTNQNEFFNCRKVYNKVVRGEISTFITQ